MKARGKGGSIHAGTLLLALIPAALMQPALAMGANAAAIDAPADAMQTPAAETPEEVIVVGRQTRRQLQLKVELAQDRMFGLFNELNADDRYDIYCVEDTRTGTLISERVCRPEFLRKAMELNARAFVVGVQDSTASEAPAGAAVYSALPQAEIDYRYPILKNKMNALTEQNREFADAVAEHHELIVELQEYDAGPGNE